MRTLKGRPSASSSEGDKGASGRSSSKGTCAVVPDRSRGLVKPEKNSRSIALDRSTKK